MSFKLGNTNIGELYVGSTKIAQAYLGSSIVYQSAAPDPYNPLGLPANTIRVKFKSGYEPSRRLGDTQILVDSTNNIWDIYKSSNSWDSLFYFNYDLLEVLGANTTNVTDMVKMFRNCNSLTTVALFDTSNVTSMYYTFNYCTSLTSVPLFDTSSVYTMGNMFEGCSSLTSVPLFDTSSVTYVSYMFNGCTNVQSGALALYQRASTQSRPPVAHSNTFTNCGSNTVSGAAELAQIPSSWGGTGA